MGRYSSSAHLTTDEAPAPPADLVTRCYLGIRDGILRRRFLPGERLAPADLAREFGVSRTPVHFALKRLALEGLVVIEPRRGTVVRRVSAGDVAEVAEVRSLIEVHAAAVAAQRVTPAGPGHPPGLRLAPGRDPRICSTPTTVRGLVDGQRPPAPLSGAARRERDAAAGLRRTEPGEGRTSWCSPGGGWRPLREFQAQHRLMLRHLEARDAPALQAVLRTHVEQATPAPWRSCIWSGAGCRAYGALRNTPPGSLPLG